MHGTVTHRERRKRNKLVSDSFPGSDPDTEERKKADLPQAWGGGRRSSSVDMKWLEKATRVTAKITDLTSFLWDAFLSRSSREGCL